MGEKPEHPLRAGVVWVLTRHLGPYKAVVRGEISLAEAAERAAVLDERSRLADGGDPEGPDAVTPPPP